MLIHALPITHPQSLTAEPLTRPAFAPFGDAISNPRPDARPSNTDPAAIANGALPFGAVSANQGTAIQYRGLAAVREYYAQAPSGRAGAARLTMFVCGTRELESGGSSGGGDGNGDGDVGNGKGKGEAGGEAKKDSVQVTILERHPFTSQTFIPLTADASKRYLVIVAPSLPPGATDEGLPVPDAEAAQGATEKANGAKLPGRGLPNVRRMRAFVATGEQAVTYAAGTWHAPMMALGPADSTIDFLVVQFANDVPVEDCQEVALERQGSDERSRIMVRVPDAERWGLPKL
ncbi:Uu.00g097140.m01.CDS01 [Anthostomella pinea]|uniref:Uu.00g097140.m01.CDS01 n=1 Tax=Anthostomella pinea TaxID=933095 RepID=A0AAI8YF00_9PEZI|nr:Uu.00g097140.m01.CDS01 [Anthostomella pinea]